MAATFVTGATMGAALLASGFQHPAVMLSQLKFDNWHMVQAFMTATAGSAVIYAVAERLGYLRLSPRSNAPLGLFAKYDGNIVGGALLGAGMALSGSCPGTLLVMIGVGVRTGALALLGSFFGGIVWTGLLSEAIKRRREEAGIKTEVSTISDETGLPRMGSLVLLEVGCAALVTATTLLTPAAPEPKLAGALGGMFIAGSQLVSILTRRTMMGVSGSYEEMGKFFWWLVGGPDGRMMPGYNNIIFASGLTTGAYVLSRLAPSLVAGPVAETAPGLAIVGGALMAIGSRMAGGCTSGHGISGISLLSTSSIVTIASTFVGGGLVALAL